MNGFIPWWWFEFLKLEQLQLMFLYISFISGHYHLCCTGQPDLLFAVPPNFKQRGLMSGLIVQLFPFRTGVMKREEDLSNTATFPTQLGIDRLLLSLANSVTSMCQV
jgi:hypothetical protein